MTSSLFKFFFITFVASWICFGLAVVVPNIGGTIFLLGVFMPAFVAISLTARAGGTAALQALFERVFQPFFDRVRGMQQRKHRLAAVDRGRTDARTDAGTRAAGHFLHI